MPNLDAPPDLVAWELEEARAHLERLGWPGPIVPIETAPPERIAASRTPTQKGRWRVLRCRLLEQGAVGAAALELLVARELLAA